jgi:site-specific DNA-methyltransferase (adenine-specific)
MKPDWQTSDGSVRLFLGDARDIVPQFANRLADAVVVDIPYGKVNRDSGGLRTLDKGIADVETFDLQFVIGHCSRLASSAYVFCGTEQVSELRAGFIGKGMTTRLGGWEKTNPSPMNGEVMWLSSFECCVFARHQRAWFGEHCASPIWRGPTEREPVHPTQKPLWLLEKIARASVPFGGTCLDFCMGSGTTGVACRRTGRHFIGVESHAPYFASAVSRIEAELNRHPLLEPAPAIQRSLLGDHP